MSPGASSIDSVLQDYLDDDYPTTPGEMRWVECDCRQLPKRFAPAEATSCDVCTGHGYKLVLAAIHGT